MKHETQTVINMFKTYKVIHALEIAGCWRVFSVVISCSRHGVCGFLWCCRMSDEMRLKKPLANQIIR